MLTSLITYKALLSLLLLLGAFAQGAAREAGQQAMRWLVAKFQRPAIIPRKRANQTRKLGKGNSKPTRDKNGQ